MSLQEGIVPLEWKEANVIPLFKTMERIEEFYSELYDSDQAVTIQTDPEEVPPIMAWEVEAALRKMKNGK